MSRLFRRGVIVAGLLGVAAAFGGVAPAEAGGMQDWQREVAKVIAKKQVYPRAALSQEIEGQAKVKITIDRGGAVTAYEIVQPTGHDVLDEEIVKLVERINPLPSPPSEMSDSQLSFILPLSWVIN